MPQSRTETRGALNVLFRQIVDDVTMLTGTLTGRNTEPQEPQELQTLSPGELERRAVLLQKITERHLSTLAAGTVRLEILGGFEATEQNPQAALLVAQLSREEHLLEQLGGVDPSYIARVKAASRFRVGALRHTALLSVVNVLGVEQTEEAILAGQDPAHIVNAALSAIVQEQIQRLTQQVAQQGRGRTPTRDE